MAWLKDDHIAVSYAKQLQREHASNTNTFSGFVVSTYSQQSVIGLTLKSPWPILGPKTETSLPSLHGREILLSTYRKLTVNTLAKQCGVEYCRLSRSYQTSYIFYFRKDSLTRDSINRSSLHCRLSLIHICCSF